MPDLKMANIKTPLIFAALAIAITLALDITGYAIFSALPLMALVGLYWLVTRHSWADWGLKLGKPGDYGLAVLYPIFVMGIITLVLVFSGANFTEINWAKALKNFAIIGGTTVLMAFLTEEGFFRGSLFAGFKGAGFSTKKIVIVTSVLFAAWHIGWSTIAAEGKLPLWEAPVYLINAGLLGMSWGLMRTLSGSVLVPSLSHGVWNGMAYTFFGLGTTPGFLAMSDPVIFGPERGLVGVALNGLFVFYLWRKLAKE